MGLKLSKVSLILPSTSSKYAVKLRKYSVVYLDLENYFYLSRKDVTYFQCFDFVFMRESGPSH